MFPWAHQMRRWTTTHTDKGPPGTGLGIWYNDQEATSVDSNDVGDDVNITKKSSTIFKI